MKNRTFILSITIILIYLHTALAIGTEEYIPPPNDTAGDISAGVNTENKTSLDFKGLDIVDALKIISMRSKMNIVVGKNVSGRVTIFLKDVDIQDALLIILASNNLAYEKKGNIINVMTDSDYELLYGEKFNEKKQLLTKNLKYAKAQDISKSLLQIKTNIGRIVVDENTNTLIVLDTPEKVAQIDKIIDNLDKPTETKVFELKYADVNKISPKIQEAITQGIGSLKIDERTNKIIIKDFPEKITDIAKIIEAFDEKPQQVRIDAQIIEINPDKDEFKMGVDWDAWLNKNFRMANSLPMGGTTKLSFGLAAANLPIGEKYDRKGIIDLLHTIGKTKILSSPSIIALNNQEARILVGSKEAYITSTTSQGGSGTQVTSQAVNFVDVGIKLYVTPTINKDGFVTMKIKPEISTSKLTDLTSEGKVTQVPIVTTSEAETTLTLKDSSTIVIAGLKKDQRENEVKKIPFLADIPLLGLLFRSTNISTTKTELVIFLTPHIINDDIPEKYASLTNDKDIERLTKEIEQPSVIEKTLQDKLQQESALFRSSGDYSKYIRNKIMSNAIFLNSRKRLKGSVLVSFVVKSNGQLSGEPLVISSSTKELEELAANTIKNSSPFGRFPNDLQKTSEKYEITIVYN